MHIKDIFNLYKTTISFEFFPPKNSKASQELFQTIRDLIPMQPSYVSVTYGAGGSTRELTHDLVVHIQKEIDLTVVSHLTCVGSTQAEILEILKKYHDSGIRNIMALRGDPPKGQSAFRPMPGGFQYAIELVAFIKSHFPDMGIGVAGFPEGHPEESNRLKEIEHLQSKVDAGADFICTQLFSKTAISMISVSVVNWRASIFPSSPGSCPLLHLKACGVWLIWLPEFASRPDY